MESRDVGLGSGGGIGSFSQHNLLDWVSRWNLTCQDIIILFYIKFTLYFVIFRHILRCPTANYSKIHQTIAKYKRT